jgi:hypothetical protein
MVPWYRLSLRSFAKTSALSAVNGNLKDFFTAEEKQRCRGGAPRIQNTYYMFACPLEVKTVQH